MSHLSADAKHAILLEYRPRSPTHGYTALAARHAVGGGARTVRSWYARGDGSVRSLQRRAGSGRPRALSRAEVSRHVRAPILAANRAHRAVHYTDIAAEVRRKTRKAVSLQTLRRYGAQELKARQQHTNKRTRAELSASLCDDIASLRRKLRRIGTHKTLFLDEVALRLSAAPNTTIVLPGEQPYVLATETSSYAKRFDMIAATVGDRVLVPKIFTPKERAGAGVKGINSAMLLLFIDDILAQAVEGLDRYPLTLVLDRASIHLDVDAILQAFHDRGSQSIKEILLMPPTAAKRLSPLDNSLFHDWKQECRKHCPVTARTIQRVMNDAWEHMQPHSHYKHCGLTRDRDVYFDCPAPALHRHHS